MMRSVVVGLALVVVYIVVDVSPASPSWLDGATAALLILAPSAVIGFDRHPRPFLRAFALVTTLVGVLLLAVWLMWTFGLGRSPDVLPPPAILLVGIVGCSMLLGAVGGVVALASRAIGNRARREPR
jgi:hypothetical protein